MARVTIGGETLSARLRRSWVLIAGGAVVLLSRLFALPRTPWEEDEFRFIAGVVHFDPLHHHPHPPGFPLFIALGKLVNLLVHDPFTSLVALAVGADVVAYVALALLFRRLLMSPPSQPGARQFEAGAVAAAGALLCFFAPAMLVHSTLALSDPPALMFAALALLAWARLGDGGLAAALAAGVLSAAAVGCRPQLAVALVPAMIVALVLAGDWRRRTAAVVPFTLVALAWLTPLALAVGGIGKLGDFLSSQTRYVALHDAGLSRTGRVWSEIVVRFVAHPWGTKWLAVPLLGVVVVGFVRGMKGRWRSAAPLLVLAAAQLAFGIIFMDPADGARYALPAVPALAWLATVAIFDVLPERGRALGAWLLVAAFAIGSAAYVEPLLAARRTSASPPVQAAQHLAAEPEGTVVLYEMPLRAHAEVLLGRFEIVAVEEGWAGAPSPDHARFWLLADRAAAGPGAVTFAWPDCDAYGKLTRNHYRVVTLLPTAAARQYRALRGEFGFERDDAGHEWRWLGPEAELRLPDLGPGTLRLELALDRFAPFPENRVRVLVNGVESADVVLERARRRTVSVPLAGGSASVVVRSAHSWVPAATGRNRDARTLAVQLVALEQVPQ
jgi:hypothetical protein